MLPLRPGNYAGNIRIYVDCEPYAEQISGLTCYSIAIFDWLLLTMAVMHHGKLTMDRRL